MLREIEAGRSFFDPSPLQPRPTPYTLDEWQKLGTVDAKLTSPDGFVTHFTENESANWKDAQRGYVKRLRKGEAAPVPDRMPSGQASVHLPRNAKKLEPEYQAWAHSQLKLLNRMQRDVNTLQNYAGAFVNMMAWMQANPLPAAVVSQISDADLDWTVRALGGALGQFLTRQQRSGIQPDPTLRQLAATVPGMEDPDRQQQWLQQLGGSAFWGMDFFIALPTPVQELLVMHMNAAKAFKNAITIRAALNVNEDLGVDLKGPDNLPADWRPRLQQNQEILSQVRQSARPEIFSIFANWIRALELEWERSWRPGPTHPNPVLTELGLGSWEMFVASVQQTMTTELEHIVVFALQALYDRSFHSNWQAPAVSNGQPQWRRNTERLQRFLTHFSTTHPELVNRARTLIGGWMLDRENAAPQPNINPLLAVMNQYENDVANFTIAVWGGGGNMTLGMSSNDKTILKAFHKWFHDGRP